MNSPFKYSSDNKRYYTFNYFLREKFNRKVFKVSLNAGMTCPNRDGTKSIYGCSFCSSELSGEFAGNPKDSIKKQFDEIRLKMHQKWPDAVYLAYFQAGTNTYAPVEKLRELYETALSQPNVVGMSISTRPDCINDEIADLLLDISKRTYLTVELGLQTIHDATAKKLNRCHTYQDFLDGYKMLSSRGINICIHIIDGLPGETREMMAETAKKIAKLHPHSVKIHLLHIIKGTRLHKQFLDGEFGEMRREDYVNTVCDQLEVFPPDTVIQRLTGDGEKSTLVAPLWSLKKFCVLNEIDKELLRRNSMQGSKFKR